MLLTNCTVPTRTSRLEAVLSKKKSVKRGLHVVNERWRQKRGTTVEVVLDGSDQVVRVDRYFYKDIHRFDTT